MAKLIVKRKDSIIFILAKVNVLIDNKEAGKTSAGKSLEIELPAGEHTLNVAVSNVAKQNTEDYKFSLSENETKTISMAPVNSRWRSLGVMFMVIYLITMYLNKSGIIPEKTIDIVRAILIPIGGLVFYMTITGRNKSSWLIAE